MIRCFLEKSGKLLTDYYLQIMKNKLITLAALGAAVFSVSTGADAAVRQGNIETAFSGSYSNLDSPVGDMDTLILDVKAGYFVTAPIEVSAGLSYLDADLAGTDLEALMVGGGVDYHFNTQSQFVPYVGAALHWVDVDVAGGGDDDWAWEAHAGLKQFVARNVAIKYQVSYIEFDDLDLDGMMVNVGLSFFF